MEDPQYEIPKIDTAYTPRRPVPNYLVHSILATLFCCVPFGIVAIVFAAQVDGKLAAGDRTGASRASDNARTWCWISFWSGISVAVLYLLIIVMAGGM